MQVRRGAVSGRRPARALGVPAGAAGTPRAWPGGLPRTAGLPDRLVEHVLLGGVVVAAAVLRGQGDRVGAEEPGPVGHGCAAEVDAAAGGVGGAVVDEGLGERDDLGDVGGGAGLVPGAFAHD